MMLHVQRWSKIGLCPTSSIISTGEIVVNIDVREAWIAVLSYMLGGVSLLFYACLFRLVFHKEPRR